MPAPDVLMVAVVLMQFRTLDTVLPGRAGGVVFTTTCMVEGLDEQVPLLTTSEYTPAIPTVGFCEEENPFPSVALDHE
jgi:hypothetical protein